MSAWWSDLSRREQLLIVVAGGLAGVLIVSMLVVRPLAQWRSDAARDAARARDGYELVVSAAALAGRSTATAPQNTIPLRQAITVSAAAAGIELIRIGTETDGQIETQPDLASGDQLFQWFANLEAQYGVTVAFADIQNTADGAVNAQVLVFERIS